MVVVVAQWLSPAVGLVIVALGPLLPSGLLAAVALDLVELEDRRVMDQPAVIGGAWLQTH